MILPDSEAATRVETLMEIACAINSELDLERVFWVIYEQCSRVFDTRNFLLVTCDPDGANIQVKVWFYQGRQLRQEDLPGGTLLGLSPEVIRLRQPLVVENYIEAIRARDLPLPVPADPGEHLAWMGVPLLVGDRLIGVITTSRPAVPYSESDARLLEAIAAQCAVAIENGRLLEMVTETVRELVRRTDELHGLNIIAAAANRSLDLPTVLSQGIQAVRRVSGWGFATIWLWTPPTGTWDLVAQEGLPETFPETYVLGPESPLNAYIEEVLASRRPVLLDAEADPSLGLYRTVGRHGVMFPLQTGDEVLGVLLLGTQRPIPGAGPGAMMTDQTLLAIGNQLAVAIKNARLLTEVQTARSHLAAVLDSTNDGIIFYNKAGRAELANRAVHKLYGLPPGSMIGHTVEEVTEMIRPALKDPTVADQLADRIKTQPEAAYTLEFELARPARRMVQRMVAPVRDDQGEMIGMLAAYHDVTETRDLARRTQQLASLNAVATAVNRSLNLNTVLDQAAASVLKATGWDTVTIRLWNPATRTWDLGARHGLPVQQAGVPAWSEAGTARDPLYERATPELLAGRPVIVAVPQEPGLDHYRRAGLLSIVSTPIQVRGQVLGIVVLGAVRPDLAATAPALLADPTLAAINEQLAVAIENARLHSQAQQAAALEERHRLARDLHDSVTQSLFTVTLMAEAAQAMIERDPLRVAAYLERLKDTAHSALAEMRALLNQLRPQGLRASGLAAALRKHAETVGAQVGLQVEVEVDEDLPDLPPAIEEALYRIAQEALHNVVKHAHATHAQIRVTGLAAHRGGPPQAVTLTVEDNGRGFSLTGHHDTADEGLGLTNMNERATSLGGNFAIVPRPAGGTVVTVAIPLA
jgi:PAS domain S-box-containing protein